MTFKEAQEKALIGLLALNVGFLYRLNDKIDSLLIDNARKSVQIEAHEKRITYVEHYFLKPEEIKPHENDN